MNGEGLKFQCWTESRYRQFDLGDLNLRIFLTCYHSGIVAIVRILLQTEKRCLG